MIDNLPRSGEILDPISIVELIDKISILKIKLKNMTGDQLTNVN